MATDQNFEERKRLIDERINQLKAQKRALENRERAQERKQRTHRLIRLGAALESAFSGAVDPEIFAMCLGSRLRQDGSDTPTTIGDYMKTRYERVAERVKTERKASTASDT